VPLWTTPAPTAGQIFEGTPTLVGSPTTGTIYAVTSDGLLVALSAATGVVAWSTQLPDVSSWGPTAAGPLAVGGRIVVQAGPEVTAVDTATHTVSWSHPLAAADPNQPTDASTDGSLVFVFDGCDVVAVHGSDGTEAWRSRVPRTVPLSCSGPFSYSFGGEIAPVVSNGVVYATEYYHGVAAFNAHTGTVRWRQNLHASITAASATEQWLVLTSHEDGILVLDNQTGALVGQTGADLPPVQSGVTVAGDLLFYNDTNQRIAAVDLTTMQQVWTSSVLAPYGFVQNRPTIAKGRIYTYTGDNRIVGIAQ
jgi:outer membrane protein assembly factor BamB